MLVYIYFRCQREACVVIRERLSQTGANCTSPRLPHFSATSGNLRFGGFSQHQSQAFFKILNAEDCEIAECSYAEVQRHKANLMLFCVHPLSFFLVLYRLREERPYIIS